MSEHQQITPAPVQAPAAAELTPEKEQPKDELYTEGLSRLPIQKKLSVGAPDDPLEQEADEMADRVMRMPQTSFIQSKPADGEDEQIHRKPVDTFIQKKGSACNEEEKIHRKLTETYIQKKCDHCEEEEKETIHRKPADTFIQKKDSGGGDTVSDPVANGIESTRGGGQQLDTSTRSFMENGFGANFSSVNIHTGGYATQLSSQLNAQAFTVGNDIYFNEGKFNTASSEGKHLLAHELTHTIQQSASIERKIQLKKGAGGDLVTYRLKVPDGITTTEQWGEYLNTTIFGDPNAYKWQYGSPVVTPGEVRTVQVPADSVNTNTDPDAAADKKSKKEAFDALPVAKQRSVNAETDTRYYKKTGDKPGTKIKTEEKGQADIWNNLRDGVINDKQKLEALSPELKELMGGDQTFQPKDYDQLLRISEKLKQFSKEDLAVYKMLALKATDNLDLFEKSVDMFLARKEQLKEAMKNNPPPQQDPSSKEPKSMQEAMDAAWNDFDGSDIPGMSESDRYDLARKRTSAVTAAQLKYMKDHPGEVAVDFVKSATLVNSGDTFKGIGKDIAEAANGDANTWARFAGGTGAGAKLSGWLLAVGGVLYVLSWLTGVGELATIAAFMAYMLAATVVLSATESELRIKAASQAKTEDEFKEQINKAAAARTNVIIALGLLALALAIRFIAKTFFPEAVSKMNKSLAQLREKIRLVGKFEDIKTDFVKDISGQKETLVKSGETAKLSAKQTADSIESMSTEEFVDKLEKGDGDFFNEASIKDGQKVPWKELAKTPEGLKAIQNYKASLVQELRTDVPAYIDAMVKEQISAADTLIDKVSKAATPEEVDAAVKEFEKFMSDEEVAKRGKAREEKVKKEMADKALEEIAEETRKAEEARKAEELRKAEEAKKAAEAAKPKASLPQDVIDHSDVGDFPNPANPKKSTNPSTMQGGGHGQRNIIYLDNIKMPYNIVHKFSNGVRVGNIPAHKNALKRTGTGQSWFPESWSAADIKAAGEYVIDNTPNFDTVPDGQPVYGNYKGVRVGVIKTGGKAATVFPDGSQQPSAVTPGETEVPPKDK